MAAGAKVELFVVAALLFSLVLFSPAAPAEAARLVQESKQRQPICPACLCCSPPPPNGCCTCCRGPGGPGAIMGSKP